MGIWGVGIVATILLDALANSPTDMYMHLTCMCAGVILALFMFHFDLMYTCPEHPLHAMHKWVVQGCAMMLVVWIVIVCYYMAIMASADYRMEDIPVC